MPLDPQAKAVCDAANAQPPVAPEDRVMMTRMGWGIYLMVGAGEPEPVFAVEERDADGVPVRVYRPSPDEGLPILVVFHGGGWTIGTAEQFDPIARQLANASGAVVVNVDYRLAPEHPFPAAFDDCWTALQWAVAHASEIGGDASRVAVGGDSAGGNLAAVCAIRARNEGGPALALQALVYPSLDFVPETESYVTNGEGYLLQAEQMRWFFDCYAGDTMDRTDWRLSPLRAADLSGVAPAVIITAEFDPLRDEGEAYAARLRDSGVAVEQRRFDGMIHAFFGCPAAFEASKDAMAMVGTALRRAFGTLDA